MEKLYYSDVSALSAYQLNFGTYARHEEPRNVAALAAVVRSELAKGRSMNSVMDAVAYFLQSDPVRALRFYDRDALFEIGVSVDEFLTGAISDDTVRRLPFPKEVSEVLCEHFDMSLLDAMEKGSVIDMTRDPYDINAEVLAIGAARDVYEASVLRQERRSEYLSRRFAIPEAQFAHWEDLTPSHRERFIGHVSDMVVILRHQEERIAADAPALHEGFEALSDRFARSMHTDFFLRRWSGDDVSAFDPDDGDMMMSVSFDDLPDFVQEEYRLRADVLLSKVLEMGLSLEPVVDERQARRRERSREFDALIKTDTGMKVLCACAQSLYRQRAYDGGNCFEVFASMGPLRHDGWIRGELVVEEGAALTVDSGERVLPARSLVDGEVEDLLVGEDGLDIIDVFVREAESRGEPLYYVQGVSSGLKLEDAPAEDVVRVFSGAMDELRSSYLREGRLPEMSLGQDRVVSLKDAFCKAMEEVRRSDILDEGMEGVKKNLSGLKV